MAGRTCEMPREQFVSDIPNHVCHRSMSQALTESPPPLPLSSTRRFAAWPCSGARQLAHVPGDKPNLRQEEGETRGGGGARHLCSCFGCPGGVGDMDQAADDRRTPGEPGQQLAHCKVQRQIVDAGQSRPAVCILHGQESNAPPAETYFFCAPHQLHRGPASCWCWSGRGC